MNWQVRQQYGEGKSCFFYSLAYVSLCWCSIISTLNSPFLAAHMHTHTHTRQHVPSRSCCCLTVGYGWLTNTHANARPPHNCVCATNECHGKRCHYHSNYRKTEKRHTASPSNQTSKQHTTNFTTYTRSDDSAVVIFGYKIQKEKYR